MIYRVAVRVKTVNANKGLWTVPGMCVMGSQTRGATCLHVCAWTCMFVSNSWVQPKKNLVIQWIESSQWERQLGCKNLGYFLFLRGNCFGCSLTFSDFHFRKDLNSNLMNWSRGKRQLEDNGSNITMTCCANMSPFISRIFFTAFEWCFIPLSFFFFWSKEPISYFITVSTLLFKTERF